jgi:Glycosyl hydrolases family 2, TIM barrel domain/Glycosyl hydrolases family 2/Glycosyl hydrolases family 2, sugar binding domain
MAARLTRAQPMPNFLTKPSLLIIALMCGAFAAAAASAGAPPTPNTTQLASNPRSLIFEGPGGRTPLTHWTLRTDPSNRGSSLGWRRGGFGGAAVSVPNDVNPRAYSGAAGVRNYEGSVAWYRTSFNAQQSGEYALNFQSANFQAQVWVDGHALGSHRGSYLPFELRSRLSAGAHTVVVRIDWRNPGEQSLEGFHRTWFNWGGLNGVVEVRPVGQSELSSPTVQTTLPAGQPAAQEATVKVTVQVRNHGTSRTLTPEGSLVHESQAIPLSFAPVEVAHGQSATTSATVRVTAPALWSPASPNLYQLSLAVGTESSYTAKTGLRQLSWHGGHLYLNGALLHLHGATLQEDAPGHGDALTPGDEKAIVGELKAIGANSARAQHPLDPALLERLDAAGILVWQGVGPVEGAGNWYSNSPRQLAGAEQQAHTAVLADELHPSIFAWNLVDEVAGNGRDGAEVSYVRNLSRWLHVHDPTRMVAVDVWGDHPPQHAGALYAGADAIAETDYSGWYDYPRDTPAQLAAKMRERLGAMERTFAGKVLVISEFGAESNRLNGAGSPGSYSFQARLLAEHIAVYQSDPKLTAMLVWVLRDYPLTPTFEGGSIHGVLPQVRLIEGLNQKGLFTYSGQPKSAAAAVAHLFKALPLL